MVEVFHSVKLGDNLYQVNDANELLELIDGPKIILSVVQYLKCVSANLLTFLLEEHIGVTLIKQSRIGDQTIKRVHN